MTNGTNNTLYRWQSKSSQDIKLNNRLADVWACRWRNCLFDCVKWLNIRHKTIHSTHSNDKWIKLLFNSNSNSNINACLMYYPSICFILITNSTVYSEMDSLRSSNMTKHSSFVISISVCAPAPAHSQYSSLWYRTNAKRRTLAVWVFLSFVPFNYHMINQNQIKSIPFNGDRRTMRVGHIELLMRTLHCERKRNGSR